MKLFLLMCLICLPVWATTFQLQTVDQQLKEADGVIMGHYLKSKGVVLENGKIATQMIFKMNKEHGLQSEFFGMDEVIIHYPGGKVEDLRVEVQGVPRFVPGEQVVIFIKSVNSRYWGLNLGMGSYKMVNYGEDTMLVNSLFPHNPQMGQMKLDEFERAVRLIKGAHLKVVQEQSYLPEKTAPVITRFPASTEEGKIRTIASQTEASDNMSAGSSIKTFWLVTILAFLGACFRFSQRRSHK